MPNQDNQADNHSAEFLLAEYSQLNEESRRLRGEGMSRLNFLITISSTALAGLVVFGQSNTVSVTPILLVSIGVVSFLSLLGWITFRFTIGRDISTDLNVLKQNK